MVRVSVSVSVSVSLSTCSRQVLIESVPETTSQPSLELNSCWSMRTCEPPSSPAEMSSSVGCASCLATLDLPLERMSESFLLPFRGLPPS